MDFLNAITLTFSRGGLVMWPIAIFSLYGFALIIERWLFYKQQHELLISVSNGSKTEDISATKGLVGSSCITKILQIITSTDFSDPNEQTEKVRNVFREEQATIERRLSTISVIATMLPMLGLLGTVVGMIAAFDVIALHGTGNPNLMAEGISQALITTEAGLLASIPMFYLHNILADKADRIVRLLDEFTTHQLHQNTVAN